MKKTKVVITGMGVVSSIGVGQDNFERALYAGESGIAKVTRFDTADLPTKIACEIKDFKFQYADRKVDFALVAASEALKQAQLSSNNSNSKSVLSIGIGLELFSVNDLIEYAFRQARPRNIDFLNFPSDLCANLIGMRYPFSHPPLIHISACSSGTDAIGIGYQRIAQGGYDVVVAGGTDSMINPMGMAGFNKIGAMSESNTLLDRASCPFDKKRNGFVLGEGAAFVVMESQAHAEKRGAKILGRVLGHGNSLDAHSVSDPHPEGQGACASMQRAILDAEISAEDIDAVSAHGTSTPKNDPVESLAIRKVLGDHYKNTPVFATKSMIGHAISASGSIEIVASLIALKRQEIHATRNLVDIDPECELFHVQQNMKRELNIILKNSFGFGGLNSTLILGKS